MKTFFKKFKASTTLDQGDQTPKQNASGEAQRFEESLRTMDGRLRESRTGDDVPPGLHSSIMRAVQTSDTEREPALVSVIWRRLAAAAFVLAIGIGVFWSLNQGPVKVTDASSSTEAPLSFAAAIEQGRVLTQTAPKAALGPLSGEWELINGDFQNAVNFVAASVP